ncbi:MAG: F0F1 ATP synthase subunit alpha, partial [Cucumibacter sp.]
LTELLKQRQFSPLRTEEQVAVIFAGVRGFIDSLPVNRVRAFEEALLGALRSKHADILGAIAKEKALSPEIEQKLRAALEAFKKTFAA